MFAFLKSKVAALPLPITDNTRLLTDGTAILISNLKGSSMSLFTTLKSDGAKLLNDLHKALLGADAVVKQVEDPATKAAVTASVTAIAGVSSGQVSTALFNVGGQLGTLLDSASGATVQKALTDSGFDEAIIADFKAVWNAAKAIKF